MKKVILIYLLLCGLVPAQENQIPERSVNSERVWGISAVVRTATVPYATGSDRYVSSFIPLIYYEGDHLYFDGLEAGVRFKLSDHSQLSVLGRLNFFDIAKKYQNQLQGDKIFWGLQYKIKVAKNQFLDTEFLTDIYGNYVIIARHGLVLESHRLDFKPFIEGRLQSANYNSTYNGLFQDRLSSGLTLAGGFTIRYHVASNLYLLGASKFQRFDNNIYNSQYVHNRWNGEIFFGFGFSNYKNKSPKEKLENNQYMRISHGWGTFSDVSDVLKFKVVPDQYNHQLSSIFFGQPMDDRLFGLPIHIYFNAGIANHWLSEVQNNLVEFLFNLKFYYTFPLPVRLRFGVAEGFSYITEVSYIEKQKLGAEGYIPSGLLNYLDFSLDFNLGDVLGKTLNPYWIGWSLHHRSGIFETAQQFGRIKGGSNYNTFYIQYHF